jgi:predicted membrane-bound spermidine synthase
VGQVFDWDESLLNHFKVDGNNWNSNVYENPRLEVIVADVFKWIKTCNSQFDAIFIDLFDPSKNEMHILQDLIVECKKRLSPYGGLSVNAGIVKKGSTTPACSLAVFLRNTFVEPSYHRVSVKVDVPSFEGTWCFLQLVPRMWSNLIHDTEYLENLQWFTKEHLLKSMQWSSEYPPELLLLLQEIRAKLDDLDRSASAKLKVSLPLIPMIASYELEMDTEGVMYKTWKSIARFFGR